MKSLIIILFVTCFGQISISQTLVQKNETIIFSFKTTNKKEVIIIKNNIDKKVYYRFGTKNNIEFQFPSTKNNSSQKLIYSFYIRGGGPSNEGMELNYINFINDNFQYVIYDTYYSIGNKQKIGVKVIDLKSKKVTDIPGDLKTKKGTLTYFRDNHLLDIGEELFD